MNTYDTDCFVCAAIHNRDHICPMHALAPALAEIAANLASALEVTDRKNLYGFLQQKVRAILRKAEL